ncbi:hypothetical protein [Bacillus timonensis]|uniref:hypothetical protein n=1 Tax=Bacillus timonensis TaxID=1033734 RepID=UPI000288E754|nr:hypothetical protein [Bacillus timonensis]
MLKNQIIRKLIFCTVVLLTMVSFNPLSSYQASAATFGTAGVDTGCGGKCHGYYANHFTARFNATSGAGYYTTSNFQATLNASNQMQDQWTIVRLVVYSSGSLAYSTTSTSTNYRTEGNSTYWQNINASVKLTKGDNRVDFNFAYILRDPSGTIKERWFPIRRSQNIY